MTDIFYTVCPPDFSPPANEKQELILCSYHGVTLYAMDMGSGQYQVMRIISSEPNDFNKADIAPGRVIKI